MKTTLDQIRTNLLDIQGQLGNLIQLLDDKYTEAGTPDSLKSETDSIIDLIRELEDKEKECEQQALELVFSETKTYTP